MKKIYLLIALALCATVSFGQKLPFQGRLLDGGRPFNGSAEITFSIANPSWTETRPAVNVVDGYYSVTLGSITPLPDTLFANSREVAMNITVNGTALSPVTLHSPLAPFEIAGSKATVVDTLEANRISVVTTDAEERIRGYVNANGFGGITIYDSLNRGGVAQLRSGTSGGVLQLASQRFSDDSFSSAILASNFGDQNARVAVYGGNPDNTNIQMMANLYAANTFADGTPLPEGYRRGGLDIFNMHGAQTHFLFSSQESNISKSGMSFWTSELGSNLRETVFIFSGDSITGATLAARGKNFSLAQLDITQDAGGGDPEGTNGVLSLWGDSSPNIVAQANSFDDHDLSVINMYGSIEDGGGWWFNSGQMGTLRATTGDEYGYLGFNNNSVGNSINTAILTGNFNDGAGGGLTLSDGNGFGRVELDGPNSIMRLRDAGGGDQIVLNGNGGFVDIFGGNGGINLASRVFAIANYNTTGAGGLELHDGGGIARVIADASNGNLRNYRSDGTETIQLNGELGDVNINIPEGNFSILNRVAIGGDFNGTGAGGMELKDPAGLNRIVLEGGAGPGGGVINVNRLLDGNNIFRVGEFADGGQLAIGDGVTEQFLFDASSQSLLLAGGSIALDGALGDIIASGTITAPVINQTSDRRYKSNIKPLNGSLENVLEMRGVSYQWKDKSKSQRNQIGVIAQEVEEVYPEFVHTDAKGMKAVNYAQMNAVLIEAIKELNAKVEKLESENADLKASLDEVQTLRKEMNQLMKMLGSSKAASK